MMLTINLSAVAGRAPDCRQNELNLIFFQTFIIEQKISH